ncbi:MAG: hypothetical protein A2W85_05725 [Bacteroidetes bacterium GWF2_41_31]|nr:MAG: hypothetical protein A2W85_05725 [Bacteroidetes bacterium GWF2_41_31]
MEFIDLKSIKQLEPLVGFKVKFVHSANMTFAYWEIKANSIPLEHKHIHEQVSMVTKGKFELTINGKFKILHPGIVSIIPSNALHSAKAITNCEITDVFYPIREDYKNND